MTNMSIRTSIKHPTRPQPRVFGPALTAQSRWTLYALTTLLVATGAAWLIAHFGRSEDALPSPVEPWSMKIHGAAAMAAIFAMGAMLQRHLLPGWRMRQNRVAGMAMCVAMGLLVVTGYGLYYCDGEWLRWGDERLHWGAGFALPLVLATHVVVGRMSRRRRQKKSPVSP